MARRHLLRFGLLTVLGAGAATCRASGAEPPAGPSTRTLGVRSLHTGDAVEVVYREAGRPRPEALREIDWVLRDHRAGEARSMDLRLLDLLWEVREALGSQGPFEVISGYRSPATNAMLVQTTTGVAPTSLHLRAMAADVRLADRPLIALREVALKLGRGGVGYYPDSGFVHLDVGRRRTW